MRRLLPSASARIREWSGGLWSVEAVRCRPWEAEPPAERVTVYREPRSGAMLSRSKACLWITFYLRLCCSVRGGGAQNAKDGKFGKFGLSRLSRSNSGHSDLRTEPSCLGSARTASSSVSSCSAGFYSQPGCTRLAPAARARTSRWTFTQRNSFRFWFCSLRRAAVVRHTSRFSLQPSRYRARTEPRLWPTYRVRAGLLGSDRAGSVQEQK